MSGVKLVVIDTKEATHRAYQGHTLIARAKFSRLMFANEVEQFRLDPKKFLGEVESDGSEAA